jgi:spermidine synthase
LNATPASKNADLKFIIASILFFLSGFTSLVYEISWQKKIYTLMGSDVFATSMILSSFMLGLALGSFLIGRVVDRFYKRLRLYGILEILIGAYAVFFPTILTWIQPQLHQFYKIFFVTTPLIYWGIKFFVLFLMLLMPTMMMGATLPLIVRSFSNKGDVKGVVSRFYGINTMGAFTGVLLSGFIFIRYFGLSNTLTIAIIINFFIGIIAILLGIEKEYIGIGESDNTKIPELTESPHTSPKRAYIILLSAFVVGLGILALEVIWTRMLVQYFSATVYSFSIMLLFALLGIFLGSFHSRDLKQSYLIRTYASLIISLGVYVTASGIFLYWSPPIFNRIVLTLVTLLKSKDSWFFASIFGKIIVAGAFIFPPCYISGMIFPMAIQLYNNEATELGQTTSRLYVANTMGSVVGPLCAGLVLIPWIGIRASLLVIAFLTVLLGVLVAATLVKNMIRRLSIAILIEVILISICLAQPEKIIANYTSVSPKTEAIFHREGFYQTISLLRNEKGQTIFMIDGNVEADNHPIQLRHFILKSHLPLLLYQRDQADVLVVGLGMGITLQAFVNNPWVRSIDVVELSPEVISAQAYLKDINGDVLNSDRVSVIVDDGRNYLTASSKKYNVISIDPIHPRISGVGTLYTKEFYEIVKLHLTKDGIFVQWMPSYQMSPELFKVAVNSFYKTFNNSMLWYVQGHFLMVGHTDDIQMDCTRLKEKFEYIRDDLEGIGINNIEDLIALAAMTPKGLQVFVQDAINVNSDDNLFLEYHAPGDYLYRVSDIIMEVQPYFDFPESYFINITPQKIEQIHALWESRRNYILEEAQKPVE